MKKIINSSNSPEEIIINPLTSWVKSSIAISKERLNFAFPFLSSFALKLLDKKTISKIADKRIITRFDDSSLSSFELETLKELLKLGFKIRFDNSIHLKLYIADNDAYVTSSNFTKAGFERSIELSVKTDSSNIQSCVAIFNEIWKNCSSNTLTEDLIDKNWDKYKTLRRRVKYGKAKEEVDSIPVLQERPFDLQEIIDEIFNQWIDPHGEEREEREKREKLVFAANKRREDTKRALGAGGFSPSIFYGTKASVLYNFAHGNEFALEGTGLYDGQFQTVFKHKDFQEVINYIYPQAVRMNPWNLDDTGELSEFCKGIFDFKIPQYVEAIPIRLVTYFYPNSFLPIFKLQHLGEICHAFGMRTNAKTRGDKLRAYNLYLAERLRILPVDNYTKQLIVSRTYYSVKLYDRLHAGEAYEKILNDCKKKWEKDLLKKGKDLLIKLKIIK